MAQVAFHGNIGKVRGLQFSQDGKPRFSFSVGESHSRMNKQTNQFEDTGTTWRSVTVFGKRAEALAETIQEGAKQQVVVIGREETRTYDNNGTPGSSLDCIADVVGIIPKAQQSTQPPAAGGFGQQQQGGFGGQQQGGGWNTPASNPSGGWGNPGEERPPF